jgi:hypothetical protein
MHASSAPDNVSAAPQDANVASQNASSPHGNILFYFILFRPNSSLVKLLLRSNRRRSSPALVQMMLRSPTLVISLTLRAFKVKISFNPPPLFFFFFY